MKNLSVIFFLLFGLQSLKAQIVPSSCSATDSIKLLYLEDADRLTLRKFYSQQLPDTNNIIISQIHADTILRALIAVYNATALPARNSVVSQYNIHTFPHPDMKSLYVSADSTLLWMQQLKAGNIPTGNAQVDNLISTYNLSIQGYMNFFGLFLNHVVSFASDSNLNIPPLTDLFEGIPGVSYSEEVTAIGDGNDITVSIFSNYVELTYSHGWGDCPAGCIYKHYWKFRVYYDCSVEFVGEFGSPLPPPPPTINFTGSNCTNQTLTVTITGATSYSLNYIPLNVSQFTLSSPTPTYYFVSAYNGTSYIISTISIIDCVTSVRENESFSSISIYPNPVISILTVEIVDRRPGTNEVIISDFLGNSKLHGKFESEKNLIEVDVSTLPNGLYLLKVGNQIMKFIKE